MGLDIDLQTDNAELQQAEWTDDHFRWYSLSRPFCHLLYRVNVAEEAEFVQISQLTGVDIAPLLEMNTYPDEEGLAFQLHAAESEGERQQILQKAEAAKAELAGNVDRVLATVEALLSRLPDVPDLPQRLTRPGYTERDYAPYFSNLLVDTGDGYIGNNFGQDLRNFRRYLLYAKAANANTVFFVYG